VLLKNLRRLGNKHFVFISFFDYISTLLFIQYKKKYNPQCSILFLNSLAHLQHHHWTNGTTTITPELHYGLEYIDKIFGLLFTYFPEDALIVHNALSQMNTNHEKPWILYRQKDPAQFLHALDIPFTHVEQHMTHDGHVFFKNAKDCHRTYERLKHATINNKSLFHAEKNTQDDCKLFYMLKFTDRLDETQIITFEYNNRTFSFFEHFDAIVTRTGRHIPMGTIYSNTISFPNHIYNHDFNKYLFHYLLPDAFALSEQTEQEEHHQQEAMV
jgi:hypothetical protein